MQKLVLALMMLVWAGTVVSAADPRPSFEQRIAQLRSAAHDLPSDDRIRPFSELQKDFPLQWDWILQDCPDLPAFLSQRANADIERQMLARIFDELADAAAPLRPELAQLANTPPTDPRWLNLYSQACQLRRAQRLRSLRAKHRQIVFTKHFNLGGSHYAYTEAQSDAQHERTFRPGTALCILDLTTPQPTIRTLIEDPRGVIRDPEVSHDGQRILFAWKKSDRRDDYHLYDLTLATGAIRQLTEGLGFADYEPAYLPNGDIIFNSTRCVQTVDCWWTEVSNLYTCDKDGRFMRRLTFDQVHDNYPKVLDDGRVIYTRWEYNDRGQIFVQSLFQMRPDGTAQMELYGNNSWFPTSILHARGIPGTNNIIGIASGHHSFQAGKLILIDSTRGRQENTGTQLIAPVRPTPAERIDAYGQDGELFAHPYPISDREFLVTYHPTGWNGDPTSHPKFGIYLMTIDGQRELLASDPRLSCNQPVP
ncbi:MAG TPA: hypothetical protein VHP11_01955, partial [Tepidisphaeraceae bacterium]|nr:hypothetical protein [Tepidisphaeraceae bacterium]